MDCVSSRNSGLITVLADLGEIALQGLVHRCSAKKRRDLPGARGTRAALRISAC